MTKLQLPCYFCEVLRAEGRKEGARGRPWAPPAGLSPQPCLLPQGRSGHCVQAPLPAAVTRRVQTIQVPLGWDRGHFPDRAAGTAPPSALSPQVQARLTSCKSHRRVHGVRLPKTLQGSHRLLPPCVPLLTLLAGAPSASSAAVQAWLPLKPCEAPVAPGASPLSPASSSCHGSSMRVQRPLNLAPVTLSFPV